MIHLFESGYKDDVRMSDARDVQVLTDPVRTCKCPGCGAKLDLAGFVPFSTARCPACRVEMQVPARLGSFLLLELLGAGGMGGAYRARDEFLNRDVAIKVMRKSFGDDPKFVETFRREAQAAAKLNHPNVVQIHSFGEAKGQPYIVMELVRGGSLDRLIAVGEPLDQVLVMRIGAEIAAALQSGYLGQLVHGDIKPENILLDEKGAAKLVDFGIAQMVGRGSTEVWGTPYYISPEKVRRQRADCRSDIYSLGGTLFHALAGKPPFDGPDATAVVKARFLAPAPPLHELRPDIDPEVESIIARMLQVEPSMRYPTYESLLGDMHRYLERMGPAVGARKGLLIRKKNPDGTTSRIATNTKPVGTVTAPVASVGDTRKTGRFVIQARAAATARISGTAPSQAEIDANAPVAPQAGPPRWLIPVLVVGGVLLVAVVAGAFWLLSRQHRHAAEGTAGAPASASAYAAASGKLAECLRHADQARTNLAALATAGEAIVSQAVQLTTGVLGSSVRPQLTPLRPVSPVRESPAGSETNATATTTGTNTVTAAPASAVPKPEPEPEPADLPPVVTKIRAMHRAWYRLEAIAAEANAEYEAVVVESQVAAGTNASFETLFRLTTALPERVNPFYSGVLAAEARLRLMELRNDMAVVREQVAILRAAKQRRDQEEARLAIERKAQEDAQKAEEARQATIRTEVAGIQAKEAEINELLHKHAYSDARRQLRTLLSTLTTDESRKAFDTALDRVKRLEDLRDFLKDRLPGYQHPQEGWKIDSADKNGLVVKGKEVAWADVGDVRMVLFIRHYLMDEEQTHTIKLREHVYELINGAMYCRKFVPNSPRVQELADKMLDRAVALLPDAKSEIERILPGAGLKAPAAPAPKADAEAPK